MLSLDLELKTNLKDLFQFICPVLGINHPCVCVCVHGCVRVRGTHKNTCMGDKPYSAHKPALYKYAFQSMRLLVQSCFSAVLVKGKTFYLSASDGSFIKVLSHSNQSYN